MQRVNCSVRLGGELGNSVFKTNVSPAEIVILRQIHGHDAVIDIQPTSMDKVPHGEERERLKRHYGAEVVQAIFPGDFSKLPVTLKEISIDGGEDADLPDEEEDTPVADDTPVPQVQPSDELTPEDREIVDKVLAAKSKAELRDMAIEHEVNLSAIPDRMDDLQKAIITGLFPNYRL